MRITALALALAPGLVALVACSDPLSSCGAGTNCVEESSTESSDGDGDGDPTGDGDGDPTGDGDGDCTPGGVNDFVSLSGTDAFPVGRSIWSCEVTSAQPGVSGGSAELACTPSDAPGDEPVNLGLNMQLNSDDELLMLPFTLGESLNLHHYFDDFPPGTTSFVLTDAEQKLRILHVDETQEKPFMAEDDWASPFTSIGLETSPCTTGDITEQFVVVEHGDLGEGVRVLPTHEATLSLSNEGDFRLRVQTATHDSDVDPGESTTYVNYLVTAHAI